MNCTQPEAQEQLLSETAVAELFSLTTKFLQKRRWLGLPPKFVKLGKAVRYRKSDIEAYIKSCEVNPRGEEL